MWRKIVRQSSKKSKSTPLRKNKFTGRGDTEEEYSRPNKAKR